MGENIRLSIYLTRARMYGRSVAVYSALALTLFAAYHILLVPVLTGPEYAPWRIGAEVYLSFHAETDALLTSDEAIAYYAEKEFSLEGVSSTPNAADLAAASATLVHVADLFIMVIGMGLAAVLTR